jgi:MerR family mercuric resistance operon transcriptional regulator
MNHLTIGQAAKLSGVGVETIRFYERQGLVAGKASAPFWRVWTVSRAKACWP